MKLSDFKFELPEKYIAKYPSEYRGEVRLMVVHRKTGKIEHKQFKDLPQYFNKGDVMIYNDTKVFPARLYGNKEKTDARIEIFLLRIINRKYQLWDTMVDPARKIRVGNKLYFGDKSMTAEIADNTTSRGRTIRFIYEGKGELTEKEFIAAIYELGQIPIPRYLKREAEDIDKERFHSIFAKKTGAVAPSYVSLHFTPYMCKMLEIKEVSMKRTTVHIGLGTFRTLGVEDMTKHKMESENYDIPADTEQAVNMAIDNGNRVCCIGTNTLKVVEHSISAVKKLKATSGWTNNFIMPPYKFNVTNTLLTNFHDPASIPLIAACTFGGYELIMHAYREAIKDQYQFLCYGDAMLIL